ncbi:MAG: pyridoxal-phosphate dependent enzyme [Arenicellales bacterium]
MSNAPTFDDIRSAARILEGHAIQTPVLSATPLDDELGCEVFLKCENLQRINAFKFRGAWNAMNHLSPQARSRGVITHSSGNHAQAVALSGHLLGVKTTIVMPDNAPRVKRAGTERYATQVIGYDPKHAKREAISRDLMEQHGYTLIPPFNDPHVIAGQGTSALELFESTGPLDALLVPLGGGGLLSGCAISARALSPQCKVIGVEPDAGDDGVRSFRSGRIERVENPQTIADGTRTEALGELTFEIIREKVADIVSVPESAIVGATKALFASARLVVEPSGALGLAALLCGAVPARGRIGILLSGGNIDLEVMQEILN